MPNRIGRYLVLAYAGPPDGAEGHQLHPSDLAFRGAAS